MAVNPYSKEKWYYLSAYAIAVKHGYMGTEEEWLAEIYGGAKRAAEDAARAEAARQAAVPAAESAVEAAATAKYYAEHIADPVGGIVSAWIEDNLSQETGYVIDEALATRGAAADARATGDLKSESVNLLDCGEVLIPNSTAAGKTVVTPTRTGFIVRATENKTYVCGGINLRLTPGVTYTLSVVPHRRGGSALVKWCEDDGAWPGGTGVNVKSLSPNIGTPPDGVRAVSTFTPTKSYVQLRFYVTWTAANEPGVETEFSDVMLIAGSAYASKEAMLPFVRHRYAQDDEARNLLAEQPDTSRDARVLSLSARRMTTEGTVTAGTLPVETKSTAQWRYYPIGTDNVRPVYSSVWRQGEDILWNRSLETFYSALANPNSVLYEENAAALKLFNAHASMGLVCSSFACWAGGFPYHMDTTELRDGTFLALDDRTVEEVEAGDLLLAEGHVMIVSQVYSDASGRPVSVDIAEEYAPDQGSNDAPITPPARQFRIRRRAIADLPAMMAAGWAAGHPYALKANPFHPRLIASPEYAADVIYYRGNGTHEGLAAAQAALPLYVPGAPATLYWRRDGGEWSEGIAVSGTAYDAKAVVTGVGLYEFTTDKSAAKYCAVKVVDTGAAAASSGVLTLSGHDGCTPVQYYVVEIRANASGKTDDDYDKAWGTDIPSGYHATRPVYHGWIDDASQPVAVEGIPASGKYKLAIDYETGYGLRRVLTAPQGF